MCKKIENIEQSREKDKSEHLKGNLIYGKGVNDFGRE
jgi:hypothetical protein